MVDTEFSKNLDAFSRSLYQQLVQLNPNRNFVFSPFSIQTCAAMVRIGAEKETASELDAGLKLCSSNIKEIANSFAQVLTEFENTNLVSIANKMYIKQGFITREDFKDILTNKFLSRPDNIDFADTVAATSAINEWVESKTNKLIKDLIKPEALNADTRLVLINAIYFKGEWKTKFEKSLTRQEDFYLNDVDKTKAPMMTLKNSFRYADLFNYDAKVLEIPYSDSSLSMLVILPNKRTGLKSLEKQMKILQLSDITSKLQLTKVFLKFPKFKAEFKQELTPVFKNLGVKRLFTDDAELGQILQSNENVNVSQIIHKAFVEVNEEGTEASAAVSAAITTRSMSTDPIQFIANHPFYYTIFHAEFGALFSGKLGDSAEECINCCLSSANKC